MLVGLQFILITDNALLVNLGCMHVSDNKQLVVQVTCDPLFFQLRCASVQVQLPLFVKAMECEGREAFFFFFKGRICKNE